MDLLMVVQLEYLKVVRLVEMTENYLEKPTVGLKVYKLVEKMVDLLAE